MCWESDAASANGSSDKESTENKILILLKVKLPDFHQVSAVISLCCYFLYLGLSLQY